MASDKSSFRNRSVFSRLVFSRFLVTVVLLLVQVALLLGIFWWLREYAEYLVGGMTLLSVILIIYIMNKDENPAYKMAWILPIAVFSVMGSLFYIFVQTNIGNVAPKKRLKEILKDTAEYGKTDENTVKAVAKEALSFQKISKYINDTGGYATYRNSDITYYPLGDDCFEPMKAELEKAEKFIFMEYFIIEEGIFWDSILEILERKVREGVEVHLMYDDLGCVALLPRNYVEILKRKGIHTRAFSRLKPFLSTHYNNRDHRKIMVIDGKVAFNGGINLADEYINQKEVFGHWKDTAYRVKGEAVRGFMLMFMQLWNMGESGGSEELEYAKYMDLAPGEHQSATVSGSSVPLAPGEAASASGYVIPYGDGPHQNENVAENVYMDIVNGAGKYVSVMTPYFIPDNEMLQALKHAAKRGVRVRLLLPHIPDKWFAIVIARSYYPDLINAGVEVYQYTPGFVHAKMFVADDEIAVVGTINLDFRSLYLHYECGSLFYKNEAVQGIAQDFENTFARSQRMAIEDYKHTRRIDRCAGHVLKLIAPLL